MTEAEQIAAIAAALRCDDGPAEALRRMGAVRHLASGDIIAHQGDRPTAGWLLLDGTVRSEAVSADGRATVIAGYTPGDLTGSWTGACQPLAGSLVAALPSVVLALPANSIEAVAASDAAFALAIARCFARQSDQLLARFAARNNLTAPGRLCARLIELADAQRAIRPAPIVAALATSVQTSRETASRTISNLERRGIIARQSDHWVIQSVRLLEEQVI
jgi:CRP/FNR family transcriptional regulator, cyclic AMP receptor protein